MSTTPAIGGVFSSSEVVKNQVLSAWVIRPHYLAQPLDAKTKARVIAQLSNPTYSIPLDYFLYSYYDRYSGLGSEDVFKAYLSTVYDDEVLRGFEHSLYLCGRCAWFWLQRAWYVHRSNRTSWGYSNRWILHCEHGCDLRCAVWDWRLARYGHIARELNLFN